MTVSLQERPGRIAPRIGVSIFAQNPVRGQAHFDAVASPGVFHLVFRDDAEALEVGTELQIV